MQLSEKLLELQSVKTNKKNLLIPLEGVLLFQREKEGPIKEVRGNMLNGEGFQILCIKYRHTGETENKKVGQYGCAYI